MPLTSSSEAQIKVDRRTLNFGDALGDIVGWWQSFEELQPMSVPETAYMPVYSTWYSYHQNLSTDALMKELHLASAMGYKTIIIDDGWQTLDSNRGYDFTGDWRADRLTKMGEFVAVVHRLGMKCMLWY